MSGERAMHDDRRMTDVEALMWNVEKDPHLSASIANITLLDRAPDAARLRSRLERATAAVPRLRQHVVPAFARLAPPEWRVDPEFDLDYHLRTVACPGSGTLRAVLDLATAEVQTPFDRTRPLWEFVVIEGMEGGAAAMVQKLHHAIADGEGSLRMSEQFIDLERDATEPMVATSAAPEPSPTDRLAVTTLDTLTHQLRRGVGVARRSVEGGVDLLREPQRLVGAVQGATDLARSLARQVVSDPARSPLWTERSLRRRVEVLQAPLDEAKIAAKALGGSLNDLFVTAAAGGAGAYHRANGMPVDELRMSMPVSTRTDRSAGGNSFAPTRVLVPAGIEDPALRFEAVRERLALTKHESAVGAVGAMAGLANLLPTSVSVRVARQQVETVDFATSNVRGAPVPLFIAGAQITASYPVGPTGGTAFNLTLMSYDGRLDMGLNIDLASVADPVALRGAIEDELEALLALG